MDDFQGTTERFLTWFKSVGGEFRDDLLAIKDLRDRDAGRGIIAVRDIPQETTLFTIPRDAIINVETSELAKKLPGIFDDAGIDDEDQDEDSEPLDSWASLILVMVYEYLQGDASRWNPYFDVLPQVFDTPIFWNENELKELSGTCLTSEKIGKQESDDMLRSRILPIVKDNSKVFYPKGAEHLGDDELLELAHRMGSTIMAYAFDLEDDNEQPDEEEEGWVEDRDGRTMLGMVPMADILNANADFNAHVNHGESLEVNSLRSSLPAGTEVLNYYGPLPSSELLRRYGYVTLEHSRYDVVELPWELVVQAFAENVGKPKEAINALVEKLDEDEEVEEYFIIERDSGAPDSEGQLSYDAKLQEISPELEEQLKALVKEAKNAGIADISDKRKREELHNSTIRSALLAKQAQYPTSVSDDEALLQKDGLPKRHHMAIQVRLGEKRLLEEAITFIEGKMSTTSGVNGERNAKRAKVA